MVSGIIFRATVRRFFSEPRSLTTLPVVALSAFVVLWPHLPNWFTPAFMGTFVILEPSLNNILFRSPNEFASLAVTPVDWTTVILSKNLGTLLLAIILVVVMAVPTAYMLPEPLTFSKACDALEAFCALILPMIIAGNLRSVQTPRRLVGASLADAAEAMITLVLLGMVALPYLFIKTVSDTWWALSLYIAFTAILWMRGSIPATARAIQQHMTRLCLTE